MTEQEKEQRAEQFRRDLRQQMAGNESFLMQTLAKNDDDNIASGEKERQMETRTCGCGVQFQTEAKELFGHVYYFPSCCVECGKKCDEELARRKEEERISQLEEKWRSICPPLYRDTDLSHPDLSPAAVGCIARWDMKRGIGLVGTSGKGKTRVLYLALRKAMFSGKFVRIISHNRFSKLVMDAFMGDARAESAKELSILRRTDYLMIDDLGKAPSTERADAEMEELVEYRVSHSLPILWSANAGGGWLEARFGPDRGPALVRRLAQFCECVTV